MFCRILSVPQNIVMALNNVMHVKGSEEDWLEKFMLIW